MDGFNIAPPIALPTQYGGQGIALPSGQVLSAVVLALLDENVARLQLPNAIIDIKANVPLTQGAHLTLALQGNGPQAKLVILSSDLGQQGQPGEPIGEAVVLGRVFSTRAPTAGAPAATSGPAPVADAPSLSPAQPDPVAQALTTAVRAAATKQGGLAPLLANLAQVLQSDAPLPAPVKTAMAQVLSAQVPLDSKLSAADLKQAAARSGVFMEARLATATPAPAPTAPVSASPAPPDLKAALLVLRSVLQSWSNETASPAPPIAPAPTPDLAAQSAKTIGLALASLIPREEPAAKLPMPTLPVTPGAPALPVASPAPPPPYRGAPTAAQPPALPTLTNDAPPHEKAERLLAQTDAALSRQTLLQTASLPDRADNARPDPAAQRLSFEIPFATPQGTAVAQFEISRDGHRGGEGAIEKIWRAHFSIDIEPIGPVHAQVTMIGERTSVTLWAEREASAARLAESTAQLARSLAQAELEPGEIQCRLGAPQRPRTVAGHFLDRAS